MRTLQFLSAIAIVAIALGFLASTPALCQKKKQPKKISLVGISLQREVEIGKGGKRPLKMHILRPKETPNRPMPVLVWIHGGGWRAGNKNSGIGRLAKFAKQGYFCASVEYRLSNEAKFPAQINDCKCAIRYLRAHAKKYHLNPDKIGVWGSSAGGHLVELLGTAGDVKQLEGDGGWPDQSSRVQAVCGFCGPSDLYVLGKNSKGAKGPISLLLGGHPLKKKDLAKLASPVTHVSKDDPPFLIVHGDKDKLVPQNQAELLHAALKKAGVDSTLYIAKGRGHGLRGKDIDERVQAFFDRHLRGEKGGGEESNCEEPAEKQETAINTLTATEKRAGWKLMFDGKSLRGWRRYGKKDTEGWTVKDGMIYLEKKGTGDLMTVYKFADFEFSVDWKFESGNNSGIIYRAAETKKQPWRTGPEMQVMAHNPKDRLGKTSGGSLYDMYAPTSNPFKGRKVWNNCKVVARGKHIQHFVNGVKVVDCTIGSEDWNEHLAKSKWSKIKEFATQSTGHITLQDHGNKIMFRNIKIRVMKKE